MSPVTRRYLVALAMVVALGSLGEAALRHRPRAAVYHPDFATVPARVGDYESRDLPVNESIYQFLAAGGMLEREYLGPEGKVRLTIIYAADWRSVHSPMGCYPAQGWEVLDERPVEFPGATGGEPLHARIVRVRKEGQERLALFSFAYAGGTTADWTLMPVKVALAPRGAGCLVFTLYTPLQPDPAGALGRLQAIFAATYPAAISFWAAGK